MFQPTPKHRQTIDDEAFAQNPLQECLRVCGLIAKARPAVYWPALIRPVHHVFEYA